MSIQKKSLISSLKTTKKANVASSPAGEIKKGEKVESLRGTHTKSLRGTHTKSLRGTHTKSLRRA